MTQMNLSKRRTHEHREQTYVCQGAVGKRGMDWDLGVNRCTLTLTYRMDKQQGPYCSVQGTIFNIL